MIMLAPQYPGRSWGGVLVVEDDSAVSELLCFHLARAGHVVQRTDNGDQALLMASESPPDLVMLDWVIEGASGIEVCRQLRRNPDTASVPVIMLSARSEEDDRVRGLEAGADDYITKPFSPRELMARVAAVLRRLRPLVAGERVTHREITYDVAAHRAYVSGRTVDLGPTEFRLLGLFVEQPGRVFSRSQIVHALWGVASAVDVRTVDGYVWGVRQAITEAGGVDPIRTVRALGYCLE